MSTTAASKKTCPRCGAPMKPDTQACPACGASAKRARTAAKSGPSLQEKMQSVLLDRVRHVTHGEFEILEELGRGGMAVVYLAHDLPLDRRVAIKVMLPDYYSDTDMAERFKREARTAAGLSHPHIIPIYSVREIDDLLFFVMKYVAGRPLDTIVEFDGRLPISVVQAIRTQVGSALAFAHRKGIVHRDIKPANVLIDEDGWAVVTDFGIAKVAQTRGLTMTGGTMGTPTYMSPEQCVGGEISGASDQYSLGIVAYQMLSGCLPFEADTVMSTMWAHVNEPPQPILNVRPDCPPSMANAIMRMLAKDPALRWPTVGEAVAMIGTSTPDVNEAARVEMQALAVGTPASSPEPADGPGRGGHPAESPATARVDRPEEPVSLITVQPPAGKITVGETLKLNGTPKAASGAPLSRRRVTWTSSAPGVAAVSSDGIVTGVGEGTATITASCERSVDVATIRVAAVPVAAVKVRPGRGALKVTENIQLEAVLTDARGIEVSPRPVRWASSDASVASVGRDGLVQGISPGSVLIAATLDGKRGVAQITVMVTRVGVASVELNSPVRNLEVGSETELHVITQDRFGQPLRKRFVQWASSNPDVARVTPSGRVLALAPGAAQVTAACGSYADSVPITVTPPRVAHLKIEPSRCSIPEGWQKQFRAVVLSPTGEAISDVRCEWMVSDPTVATVSPERVVTTHRPGSVMVAASADGKRATSRILVTVA